MHVLTHTAYLLETENNYTFIHCVTNTEYITESNRWDNRPIRRNNLISWVTHSKIHFLLCNLLETEEDRRAFNSFVLINPYAIEFGIFLRLIYINLRWFARIIVSHSGILFRIWECEISKSWVLEFPLELKQFIPFCCRCFRDEFTRKIKKKKNE